MTVAAHNTKRPHYRVSMQKSVQSSGTRHSLYRELHPEMFDDANGKRKTRKSQNATAELLIKWIKAQSEPVTIAEMAAAAFVHRSTVETLISRKLITGITAVGSRWEGQYKVKRWKIKEPDTPDKSSKAT